MFAFDTSGFVYMPTEVEIRPGVHTKGIGWPDLAPETLMQITGLVGLALATGAFDTAEEGAALWSVCAQGIPGHAAPLVPYLADDGKVRFKEA